MKITRSSQIQEDSSSFLESNKANKNTIEDQFPQVTQSVSPAS